MKAHDVLPLGERLVVEAALEDAYTPLRERTTDVSGLRVRAAVRWGRGASPLRNDAPRALRWSGAIARLSELSVAVGMFVMIFTASVGTAVLRDPGATTPGAEEVDGSLYPVPRVSVPLEDERYIRWLRIDRYVPLQDWLEPSTVRPGVTKRLELPAPRAGTAGPY